MVRHTMFWLAVIVAAGAGARAAGPARLDDVLGMKSAAGAFVVSINPGSPAELVGLDVCDLIAGFNGQDFRKYGASSTFVGALKEASMFSSADLEVWRVSDSLEVVHKDDLKLRIPLQEGTRIGAAITFQILIVGVVKDGPADLGSVRAGEFIDQVNGQKVSAMPSVNEVDQMIVDAAQRDGKVTLTLAQWKPVRGSAQVKTTYQTRNVVVEIGPQ